MSLYPEPDNLTNLDETVKYVNTVSGGLFGPLLAVSLSVVIFIVLLMKKWHPSVALTTASFIFTVLSIYLTVGEYLNVLFPIAGTILVGIGYVWMRSTNLPE